MRSAPGRDWVKFDSAKFEQYPATTRESREFKTTIPVIPYKLPELLKAVASGHTIVIAEGELKVEVIATLGFPATCCPGGAGKWLAEHSAYCDGADVVLPPDNDDAGRDHMIAVAESLVRRARRIRVLTLPNLPLKGDVVDWIDLVRGDPAEEFARLLSEAPDYVPDEAFGPQPLMRPSPQPESYPLDALGPELAEAASAIRDIVQSPIEMCAGSVQASTSFANSAHINIRLPTRELKPVFDWFWIISESGDRKTATDNLACAPYALREQRLEAIYEAEREQFRIDSELWKSQNESIKLRYKKEAAGSDAHRQEITALGPEPEAPLEHLLIGADFTYEGMLRCLQYGQPLYGVFSSEGGQFIGGHGLSSEAKIRTAAGLSEGWDGLPFKRIRAKELVILRNRRVGMHVMVQPEVAAIALTDEILNGQGFMSRILICAPDSRLDQEDKEAPPEAVQALQRYQSKLLSILERPYPLVPGKRAELAPREVTFSAEASKLFWRFSNEAKRARAPGGEFDSIKPFAAKLPEHAARLGANIAAYRDIEFTELSEGDYVRGMRLALYHASEAKRLTGLHSAGSVAAKSKPSPAQMLGAAQLLLDWLPKWDKPTISVGAIYSYGPSSIRDRQTALLLAEILVEHRHLEPCSTKRKDVKKWLITTRKP
jgi:hypothetical protein